MSRVEFKIREVKSDWLEKVILQKGAKKIFDDEVFTTYYDRPSDHFLKSGKRVTVSKNGHGGTISFKDKYSAGKSGVSNEIEVEVSDPILMDKMMIGLGFAHFKVFKKCRRTYEIGTVTLTFDKYMDELDFIPEFLIIEADEEKEAYNWAETLGYKKEALTVTTVLELIKFYRDLSEKVEKSIASKTKKSK